MFPVVILLRDYRKDSTIGKFILPDGTILRTIERPWLNNAPNISCIPEGQYRAAWLPRSASGRYKRVWHVRAVQGRTGILIHAGNLVRHSLGCILPGMRVGALGGRVAVLSSAVALNKIRRKLGGKDFTLVILDGSI